MWSLSAIKINRDCKSWQYWVLDSDKGAIIITNSFEVYFLSGIAVTCPSRENGSRRKWQICSKGFEAYCLPIIAILFIVNFIGCFKEEAPFFIYFLQNFAGCWLEYHFIAYGVPTTGPRWIGVRDNWARYTWAMYHEAQTRLGADVMHTTKSNYFSNR